MTEKASIFYMKYVALKPQKWQLCTILQAVFDYCFPPDYKLQLHHQLMQSFQGSKPFRDFARDTKMLAKHFPDMSKHQIIQIIWDGAQQYICLEWVKAGCSLESTSLSNLIKRAVRYESAELLRKKEGDIYFDKVGRKQICFTVIDYSDDYLCTDWTDPSISHLIKRSDIEEGWTVPDILERTKLIAEDLEQYAQCQAADAEIYAGAAGVKSKKKKSLHIEEEKLENVQQTAMKVKDFTQKLAKPIIVEVFINGSPAQALFDSGSLADFISTTLANQLHLQRDILQKPLTLQIAVQGSQLKINCSVAVNFLYQNIKSIQHFDIVNLDTYDIILGTPFIFQHSVLLGLNPSCVLIESEDPLPLEGESITTIQSAAMEILESELDRLRYELKQEAADLYISVDDTTLPPLQAVNHTIPLIDKHKVYSWYLSRSDTLGL
ncbi:hypothetical protein Clacol_004604 [Clathrus columnatus]|uniref:Uncharacterized protein n=1 Tax=Clathrus columnatus TaxID=1419009 RepID=A0AAV5ACK7_9AGAM|nr:hypothetical protein Clacol_004604 [Clathrus columnatus]